MIHFGNLHHTLRNVAVLQVVQEAFFLLWRYRKVKFVYCLEIQDFLGFLVKIHLFFTRIAQVDNSVDQCALHLTLQLIQ